MFDTTLNRSGKFTISCHSFIFKNCYAVLSLSGKEYSFDSWKIEAKTPEKMVCSAVNATGKWQIIFTFNADKSLTVYLKGKLKKLCNDIKLAFRLGKSVAADHLLVQGIKMGSCSSRLLDVAARQDFEGFYQLLLTKDEESLRLSYPLQSNFIASFTGVSGKKRIADLQAQTVICSYSGKDVELPPLTFCCGNGFDMLINYAEENRTPGKDFSDLTAPGWNSWDYYRWTVTEDDVLENAEFIASDPVLSKHVKRIIVDDGWQYAYGEWEANSLFPHGMKYLADQIRRMGMSPGLWVAPAIVDLHARIAQMCPDMLAKNPGGIPAPCWEIMKRRVFLLDVTVPESQRFIQELFEKMLTWGYEYFKLDFLGSLLYARSFADRSIPQGKLMDLSIGTAYRQVAGRAKMLGCNYLFNGGPQITDIVRVGSDIHAGWNNIKSNAIAVAARFWSNKRLWVNDPDFALCRSNDTCDDPEKNTMRPCLVFVDPDDQASSSPWYDYNLVSNDVFKPQMEVLLSVVLMAGGAVNLSDRMCKLNEAGLNLARKVVSAESGEAAIPLDLFKSAVPSYWMQKLSHGYRVLLVNWLDRDNELSIDLDQYGINSSKAVDFWNERVIPLQNGKLSAVLPARSCLLVEIR